MYHGLLLAAENLNQNFKKKSLWRLLGASDNVNIETDNQNLLLPAAGGSFDKIRTLVKFQLKNSLKLPATVCWVGFK